MAKKLNGDVKVVVERIDNLKEHMNEKFKELIKNDETIFNILGKYNTKIATNGTLIKVGGGILTVVVIILIKLSIG